MGGGRRESWSRGVHGGCVIGQRGWLDGLKPLVGNKVDGRTQVQALGVVTVVACACARTPWLIEACGSGGRRWFRLSRRIFVQLSQTTGLGAVSPSQRLAVANEAEIQRPIGSHCCESL